jgi:hypothetical protein
VLSRFDVLVEPSFALDFVFKVKLVGKPSRNAYHDEYGDEVATRVFGMAEVSGGVGANDFSPQDEGGESAL